MINVEAEISKYKNCRDRDELEKRIKEYKSLAFQYASDIVMAGQYNKVALKLQEIFNKIPAPPLKKPASGTYSAPTKTATITKEENTQINAAWKKMTTNK
jgi:hypothetical protein